MGLLDELEQEAQRRRAEQAEGVAARENQVQVWTGQLAPAMRDLAEYLEKLTTNLGYLKRRSRYAFEIPGYGPVIAYADPEFQLRSDATVGSHEIVLEFHAQVAPEECPVIAVDGLARVKALDGAFQQRRLSAMQDARKGANGEPIAARFHARGRIPLRIAISADAPSGMARMQMQNMEGFGSSSRSFAPAQLTPELFDALGRFITREDLDFARERLPDDMRKQLRSRIEREQLQREWEQKLARQLEDDEARVLVTMAGGARAGSLLGRLGLAARRLVRR